MRALSAAELLSVWERGFGLPPHERALSLLAMACPESSAGELSSLTIGERDGRLLTLREWTFGKELSALMTCPACENSLEVSFYVSDITVTPEAQAADTHSLYLNDYDVLFRLPNSTDLAALHGSVSVAEGERVLLARCLLSARKGDAEVGVSELPVEVLDAIAAEMDTLDPQANVQLEPECVHCGHRWKTTFDIESFFWSEIQAWAARTLREVHSLAQAYGWREAEILALSPQRRRFYLEMLAT
ncbi:MAG: phage baseplate protein [Pyrinomonadaceae bacterium]|nr:phage baseplate protein [Pyrinomonadaceae bacterium]